MLKPKITIAAWLAWILMALPTLSHAEVFDIEAQSLATALSEFARQSGQQLFFSPDIVASKNSPGVKGTFAPMEALNAILRDTGVSFSTTPNGAILLRRGDGAATNVAPQIPVTLARAAEAPAADKQANAEDPSGAGEGKVQEVMVTGTRIKAAGDRFSPVVQISRDDMDLAGHATVGDAMGALPQNFGGGVSLDTVFSGSSDGPGAVAINLRGLGNGATLTLLNGRRLAPGGMTGSFVDISSIPSAAIERVDVMMDGASAIYGSDAIAGVVNIVLREDFQGAESRVGLATLTEGDSTSYSLGQTFGFSRERSHGLLTYEYAHDGELDAQDREWASSMGSPTWLLPKSERHAVFASLGGRPADGVRLSLDAYYNKRDTDAYQSNIAPTFRRLNTVDVEQLGAAAGMSIDVLSDWKAEVSAAYSRSLQEADIIRLEVPPGAPGNRTDALTQVYSADASLGGPLFEMPGGAVRGVFGAHYRKEGADQMNFNTTSGAINFDVDKSRKVRAAYGEIYAPLLSGSARRPNAEVLTLSLAARYEDYNDVGSTSDARAGINWSVVEGLNLRATYGTSFRAPRLDQLRDVVSLAALVDYLDPQAPGGQSVALYIAGNSSDLKPEEADTWTAGFDLRPTAIPGLSLRATYFDVEYDGRVGTADVSTDAQFRFFDYTGIPVAITGATARSIAASALTYLDFTLGARDLDNVTVLLSSVPQNLSSSEVSGVDVDLSYDLPVSAGGLNLYLNSTYLTSFTRRVTPSTPLLDLRNTFSNPVDLRVRAGMQLRSDRLAASMALNYIDAYRDQEVVSGPNRIGAWTTVDASVRLELGAMLKRDWARASALTLSVNNLLDRAPPRVAAVPLRLFPFDAANSDPSGRRIGLLWTTRW